MQDSWYEGLMSLRNRWALKRRTPKNLCKTCLLRTNCSRFCNELSIEVLGDVIDHVGIGVRMNGLTPRTMDVLIQPETIAENVNLTLVVKT